MLEEEHLRMPEAEVFLLGIVWWNTATKSYQGMECQNLLPYTCDVKGAQNDITMNWDGKQFVIDEIERSSSGKKSIWHEVWSDITPPHLFRLGNMETPADPGNGCSRSRYESHDNAQQDRHRPIPKTTWQRILQILLRNCRVSKGAHG